MQTKYTKGKFEADGNTVYYTYTGASSRVLTEVACIAINQEVALIIAATLNKNYLSK